MNSIPTELLHEICLRCDAKQIVSLKLLNKRICSIVGNDTLWKRLMIRDKIVIHNPLDLSYYQSYKLSFKPLQIYEYTAVDFVYQTAITLLFYKYEDAIKAVTDDIFRIHINNHNDCLCICKELSCEADVKPFKHIMEKIPYRTNFKSVVGLELVVRKMTDAIFTYFQSATILELSDEFHLFLRQKKVV